MMTKRRHGLCWAMVRFDPADHFDDETAAADSRGAAPVALPPRCPRQRAAPSIAPTNPLSEQAFPSWARPPTTGVVGADSGVDAVFRAGASLALLDQILRLDPPFAGALRQRLALRAATACAALARHREDSSALRDAEHLSPNAGGNAPTSPAGRVHRLWRGFAARPAGFEAENLRRAADLLELPQDLDLEALAEALRHLFEDEKNPLVAAARAGSTTARMLDGAPRAETEILALWLSDLTLARKLGWEAPIALLATTIARPSSRSAGRRPRPGDADWPLHCAKAVALAAREAHGLAADLSRRSAKLLSVAPKLRAKGASRVIEMLLADDAVSPAKAARATKLSDRASRRLFDRLV
ncbi:MAG TPA: DUF1403 family protein, partial [Methylocystis sp.]